MNPDNIPRNPEGNHASEQDGSVLNPYPENIVDNLEKLSDQIENPDKIGGIFEALLKKPSALAAYLEIEPKVGKINLSFFLILSVCVLLYGLTIGFFSMHEQLWAAPVKVYAGILISAVICFPSLYIFTCISGANAGLRVIFSALLGTLALMGILLVGFAPIIWVFSQSTHSLGFMGFLMLATWVIAFIFALGFLFKVMKRTGAVRLGSVKVWASVFLLVTLQMSTSLRPIIGRDTDLLTNEKKFFLQHWADTFTKGL